MNVTHDSMRATAHDLYGERIASATALDGTTLRLKAIYRRNSYDFQSQACVQVWTDAGWKTLLTEAPDQYDIFDCHPAGIRGTDFWKAPMSMALAMLLDAGAEVMMT